MILSDHDIKVALQKGQIKIDPYLPEALQPASYDLRLGNQFLIFDETNFTAIDVKQPVDGLMREIKIKDGEAFILHPGEFALGVTMEKVGVNNELVWRLEGKSSLGRLGVLVHATAGYIDPGNYLKPTLELHNVGKLPIKLYPRMFIAQAAFHQMVSPCDLSYGQKAGSHYYGDEAPKASQIYQTFKSGTDYQAQPKNQTEIFKTARENSGRLIVLEGVDGAGKSTQRKLLQAKLEAKGFPTSYWHFPQSNSYFGSLIKDYLAGRFGLATAVNPYFAALLYMLDRYEAAPKIKQALSEGKLIILDRYATANFGYQRSKLANLDERTSFQEWLEKTEYQILANPKEDLVIFLDIHPKLSQRLLAESGKILDQHEQSDSFLDQAYQSFREIIDQKSHWHSLSCSFDNQIKSAEEIHQAVWAIVQNWLNINKEAVVREARRARW